MSDPIKNLKSLANEGTPMTPLSAAEVRRRGDRLRRRRTMLSATGVAAAVAVIATGGVLATQNVNGATPDPGPITSRTPTPTPTPSQSPTPTPSPSPTPTPTPRPNPAQSPSPAPSNSVVDRLTTIPPGMDLTAGLEEPGGDNGRRETTVAVDTPWSLDPCQRGGQPNNARTDFLGVSQPMPSANAARELAVHQNPEAAEQVLDEFPEALDRCSTSQYPGGAETRWRILDAPTDLGADDAIVVVGNYHQEAGYLTTTASHFVVVRVGNAVLIVATHGEFGQSQNDEAVKEADRQARGYASTIIEKMCIYAADPCL